MDPPPPYEVQPEVKMSNNDEKPTEIQEKKVTINENVEIKTTKGTKIVNNTPTYHAIVAGATGKFLF